MRLYKKLVYVGSIWSLLQYSILVIVSFASVSMLSQSKQILEIVAPDSTNFVYSLIHLSFLFGMCGIVTSGIVIFSVKKIKKPDSIRRKLSIILIITGIVLFVLQMAQFYIMANVVFSAITSLPYYSGSNVSITDEKIAGVLFGIIPSIILVISGILAMKFNENQKLNI